MTFKKKNPQDKESKWNENSEMAVVLILVISVIKFDCINYYDLFHPTLFPLYLKQNDTHKNARGT